MRIITARLFTNALSRRLAVALGNNSSIMHTALDSLWIEFNDNTTLSDGTKAEKATEMIRKISEKRGTDQNLLAMINETFFSTVDQTRIRVNIR
jgi:hypothetical protein